VNQINVEFHDQDRGISYELTVQYWYTPGSRGCGPMHPLGPTPDEPANVDLSSVNVLWGKIHYGNLEFNIIPYEHHLLGSLLMNEHRDEIENIVREKHEKAMVAR
jgi:hypothetical protein